MNRLHRWYCRSDNWARSVEKLVPWTLGQVDLGDDLLEIGPGPGRTTDILRTQADKLTAVEIDEALADNLRTRLHEHANVTVVTGDATQLPFEDGRFSAAVCFTMLHHVPSAALQDQLFAEVHRVLRPGAAFAGSDSRVSPLFRAFHWFDTLVPVDPDALPARLGTTGFTGVEVSTAPRTFRFRALKQ